MTSRCMLRESIFLLGPPGRLSEQPGGPWWGGGRAPGGAEGGEWAEWAVQEQQGGYGKKPSEGTKASEQEIGGGLDRQ